MTVTQSHARPLARGRAKRKTAFGRLPLLVTCGNRDIGDTFGTTLRDRVAVRDSRLMVTERDARLIVTLGDWRRG